MLEAVGKLSYIPSVFARGLKGKKLAIIGVVISDIRESFIQLID